MTNLNSILKSRAKNKSRAITLSTKVHLVKAMVFPVVMYGCESWTIKKAECRRIDAFELWCWRRLLNVPWTARRSNQSILKEVSPEYSLERTDVEAETPILWPPHAKNWLIGKDSDAGKDLSTTNCTYQEHCQCLNNNAFAICHLGDWTPRCYSCWPSTTPEGVQGSVRHSVLQGIWQDRSVIVGCF